MSKSKTKKSVILYVLDTIYHLIEAIISMERIVMSDVNDNKNLLRGTICVEFVESTTWKGKIGSNNRSSGL